MTKREEVFRGWDQRMVGIGSTLCLLSVKLIMLGECEVHYSCLSKNSILLCLGESCCSPGTENTIYLHEYVNSEWAVVDVSSCLLFTSAHTYDVTVASWSRFQDQFVIILIKDVSYRHKVLKELLSKLYFLS